MHRRNRLASEHGPEPWLEGRQADTQQANDYAQREQQESESNDRRGIHRAGTVGGWWLAVSLMINDRWVQLA